MTDETRETDHIAAPAVELREVTKTLGDVKVLDSLDLQAARGEFVSLLGPSGAGKSTILNVAAGFLPLESGQVFLMGEDVTGVPAHKRGLGFIFQEYALFPHMTVEQNVRFPLDMRKVSRSEARERVVDALKVVGLAHVGERRPHTLSGGQRQRVAIARAMVFRPSVLLMDEPLSSLDRQLRDEMTVETRRLQRELGVTVLYVTHDQTEALSLSDRVGILRHGRIEQIASPAEVHDAPRSIFAARLCGPLNVASGARPEPAEGGDGCRVQLGSHVVRAAGTPATEDATNLAVRPYLLEIQDTPPPEEKNALPAVVTAVGMVGNGIRYDVDLEAAEPVSWHVLMRDRAPGIEIGDRVHVVWAPRHSLLLPD